MPEELNSLSETLVPGIEIIRCIQFMQEHVGLHEDGSKVSSLTEVDQRRIQAQNEALDELVRRLSIIDSMASPEGLLNPSRTYTQVYWLQVIEHCRDISGDAQFFFHYGARHTPEPIKVFAAKWPIRPEHLFRRISNTFPNWNEWEVESFWITNAVSQSALVRWRSSIIASVPIDIRVQWIRTTCQIYQGMFSILPTQANLIIGNTAEVYEIQCLSEGADWCEWQFIWHQPRFLSTRDTPRTRAWWFGSIVSFVILIFSNWKLPQIQSVFNWAVSLLPLGVVFFYERMKRASATSEAMAEAAAGTERSLHDRLRNQRSLSQRQFERSERANAELQAINQTLEQRVEERTYEIEQRASELATALAENTHLYNELEENSKQLEIASRHKSEFLANMSHELRTPLNAIIGFSDVLLEKMFGDLNAKQTDYLQDILSSGQHLLALINDILDISKVEAGRMDLERTRFSLADVLENGLRMFHERANRHGINLRLQIDEEIGLIEAHERMVKQVIVNLLSNAVKFTPDGGQIGVSAQIRDGEVWISVHDTGIGIASEDQLRIFDEFQQARSGMTRTEEGTGLGLTLSKKFVELHGGRIWVESKVGMGSTFTFTLPLRTRVETDTVKPILIERTGPLILLVEDDGRAIDLLTLYLTAEKYSVVVAHDGNQGLDIARRLHPAAIILDIMLPRLDGWDFLVQAKDDPDIASIPVIIVSILDERGKGIALGAAEYIVKPASRDHLLTVLRHLTQIPKRNGSAKVLVIDDDLLALELMEAVLQPEGYTVLKAINGEHGVALAQQELPCLIILDLLMPAVDGFAVVERLRAETATAHIPIIILTSKTMTREEKERLNGQISYLAHKAEFNRAAFVESVRSFVGTTL